jgi:hypothetical protein
MNFFSASVDSGDRFNTRNLQSSGQRSFGVRYPSPFFDVAQQFLPDNVHQLLNWCRYYFLSNPIINVACTKMAEYPVTPIIFDTDDPGKRRLYQDLEEQLNLRQFQVEAGLDYFAYGNAFVSVYYPFVKYLACRHCKERYRADANRSLYRWKNNRFHLSCPSCRKADYAEERDVYIRSVRDIRLVRWNPENIQIKHNEVTGLTRYYYKLSRAVLNDITMGDPETVERLPLEFLEAARKGKSLRFSPDNFFHLKRPTLAQKDQGWGSPLIYPLLKDAFYLQTLKKAQESIAMEHIVPLRMIFPGPSTGGNDQPYGSYNLTNWKSKIETELSIWKRDNNYIPILPVNIGLQQFGGDARALMLHQEFRLVAEQMLVGAGIPIEFVFGGLSWSGSNTSLRALENMFMGYNRARHRMVNDFIFGGIAAFMRWPKVSSRFDRFKMADDLQRSMFYLQLNQALKISDKRLHEELGEDTALEVKRMHEEMKIQLDVQRRMQTATADIQGEAQLRSSRYSIKAQALQGQAQMEQQQQMAAVQQQQAAEQAAAQGGQPQSPLTPAQRAPNAQTPEAAQQNAAVQGQEQQAPAQEQAAPQEQEQPPEQAQQTPGMPQGATAYDENAGSPGGNLPVPMAGMSSPLTVGQGGVDLRYVARRAKAYLDTVGDEQGEAQKQQELMKMRTENPALYQLVIQLMNEESGSQVNPMNALKAPVPAGGSQRALGRQVG